MAGAWILAIFMWTGNWDSPVTSQVVDQIPGKDACHALASQVRAEFDKAYHLADGRRSEWPKVALICSPQRSL